MDSMAIPLSSVLAFRALEGVAVAPESRRAARADGSPERMTSQADEQTLMSAYASGDDRSFGPLFATFAPRLLAFFRRSFSDASTAEDLVQQTFVKVHAARASYQRGAPVRPWLFTIAARIRIDELRTRYRLPRSAPDTELEQLEDERAPSASAQIDQDSRDRAVREAVDALPPSQRVVVQLHRFEGMTFPEIGATLNLNEVTVRVRAFRAYATLRERLRPLVSEES
jgi:RNA polymerase sigma-70 factor (ECF subfamily)